MLIKFRVVWDMYQYWNVKHLPSIQNHALNCTKKLRSMIQKLNNHEMRLSVKFMCLFSIRNSNHVSYQCIVSDTAIHENFVL